MTMTVGIGGLGAIGLPLAKALDKGVEGLRLAAVSGRDPEKTRRQLAALKSPPRIVALGQLADADIVVEALPAARFDAIAESAIDRGRIFVPCSVGVLLRRMDLVERARKSGARIVVPTGAILGLDAVRAAAEGTIHEVKIETRKPPGGLAGAPYLERNRIDVSNVKTAQRVFEGNAYDAAQGFPANVNVAAALALAGVGPERTRVEIWADPGVTRNTHTITVDCDTTRFKMTIEGIPSEENPRTGKLTPLSVLTCLRGLVSTLKVGS